MQIGHGLEAAFHVLKQERRFFREQQPKLATAADSAALDAQLEQYQQQILRESTERNELGLYRNAALVLGCLAIVRGKYETALDHILDVVFLDVAGSTNSVPGRPSFDARLSVAVPLVIGILRDLCGTLELQSRQTESLFRARWARFSSFENPTVVQDSAWRTVQAALRA